MGALDTLMVGARKALGFGSSKRVEIIREDAILQLFIREEGKKIDRLITETLAILDSRHEYKPFANIIENSHNLMGEIIKFGDNIREHLADHCTDSIELVSTGMILLISRFKQEIRDAINDYIGSIEELKSSSYFMYFKDLEKKELNALKSHFLVMEENMKRRFTIDLCISNYKLLVNDIKLILEKQKEILTKTHKERARAA